MNRIFVHDADLLLGLNAFVAAGVGASGVLTPFAEVEIWERDGGDIRFADLAGAPGRARSHKPTHLRRSSPSSGSSSRPTRRLQVGTDAAPECVRPHQMVVELGERRRTLVVGDGVEVRECRVGVRGGEFNGMGGIAFVHPIGTNGAQIGTEPSPP